MVNLVIIMAKMAGKNPNSWVNDLFRGNEDMNFSCSECYIN